MSVDTSGLPTGTSEDLLAQYAEVTGEAVVDHLRQLARALRGARIVHVNSTRTGGGVAEILNKLVPLSQALGLDAEWLVIEGEGRFYDCTKTLHNGLQGEPIGPETICDTYEETNRANAEILGEELSKADFVFIHDPQPAPLLRYVSDRRGKWIWRCHIDLRRPYRPTWKYLRPFLTDYDASIFSLPEFAQSLPHPQYIIPPSIDPLSDKNRGLPPEEVDAVFAEFDLDPELPLVVQISRFDRFKDPIGVIEAYRLVRKMTPLQLVLAGGAAGDDPEGAAMLHQTRLAAEGDTDIHVLLLPPDAHRTVNALQRASTIVIQKSLREGFGLTVTEGLWKGKPVIGGDTGGIRMQVVNHHTGFLVRTPEGAALRMRYLLHRTDQLHLMGRMAHRFVLENFLITRQLRDYLAAMVGMSRPARSFVEVKD